jgi:hypothetical protein
LWKEKEPAAVMAITLTDEQTRLVLEVGKAGAARSSEEAVDQAVRALHSSAIGKKPVHQQVDDLADLFANPPFVASIWTLSAIKILPGY